MFRGTDVEAAHRGVAQAARHSCPAPAGCATWPPPRPASPIRGPARSASPSSRPMSTTWPGCCAAPSTASTTRARAWSSRRAATGAGQGRVPVPRPGQPEARRAGRPVRRLPGAARIPRARPGVGGPALPAGRVRRRHRAGPGRSGTRHPGRPAGARHRRARRRPRAAPPRRTPGHGRRPQLRRVGRALHRGRLRPGHPARPEPGAGRGHPRRGRRRPGHDGRGQRHRRAGPGGADRRRARPARSCWPTTTPRPRWSSPAPPRRSAGRRPR